jgi:hypothetical protein
MQFTTINFFNNLNIEYDDKLLLESHDVKFLGITLENTTSWNKHTDSVITN